MNRCGSSVTSVPVIAWPSREVGFQRPNRQPEPVRIWKLDALVDTCYSYRADGEVMRQMKARAG